MTGLLWQAHLGHFLSSVHPLVTAKMFWKLYGDRPYCTFYEDGYPIFNEACLPCTAFDYGLMLRIKWMDLRLDFSLMGVVPLVRQLQTLVALGAVKRVVLDFSTFFSQPTFVCLSDLSTQIHTLIYAVPVHFTCVHARNEPFALSFDQRNKYDGLFLLGRLPKPDADLSSIFRHKCECQYEDEWPSTYI